MINSENYLEIVKAHRTAQDKYTYFLLAVAGASIGFSLSQTQAATISWSKFPFGFSIIFWGASFFCGCRHINYLRSILYTNAELLKIQGGTFPYIGMAPGGIANASQEVYRDIESLSRRAGIYALWQFRCLVAGAISYIIWHVLEMYLRS